MRDRTASFNEQIAQFRVVGEISSILACSTVGNEDTTPADTRIFSSLPVAGLCVSIGRYWYLFKRLTSISAGRFYRFEHVETDSSFKAHSKQLAVSRPAYFFFDNGRCMFCSGSGTGQAQPKRQRCPHIA